MLPDFFKTRIIITQIYLHGPGCVSYRPCCHRLLPGLDSIGGSLNRAKFNKMKVRVALVVILVSLEELAELTDTKLGINMCASERERQTESSG